MRISPRLALALMAFVLLHSGAAQAKCDPKIDKDCADVDSVPSRTPKKSTNYHHYSRRAAPTSATTTHPVGDYVQPLQPVRAYLRAADVPPPDVGAYGIVVFHSRPTDATRAKMLMVCKSFVANFPTSDKASVPAIDQMVTIWPIEKPDAPEAQQDDCNFVIDNYDLVAAESAITDATRQHGDFSGEGPFLVGWSPTKARNMPDALVLVIDMSADKTQDEIDHQFLFWKNEIVQDPSKWRGGFSVDRIRVAARNYADTYGQALMDGIKLFTGGKSQ